MGTPARHIVAGIATMALVFAVYLLSVGPAFWCCQDAHGALDQDDLSDAAFLRIYSPLLNVYHGSRGPVRNVVVWYLDLWDVG